MKTFAPPRNQLNKPGARPKWFSRILKRLIGGMLIALLLMAVSSFIGGTSCGRRLEAHTYEFLQAQLTVEEVNGRLPILVVDIGKVPGGKDGPTPRQPLREILRALADKRPKAIAIDVDFSPSGTGWKVDDDPQFFDFCLSLKKETGVAIFLAVYDSWAEPADEWLGLPKYKELAAAGVAVPKNDKRRLIRWIQVNDASERLTSMGAALATAYRPSLPGPPNWATRAIEVTTDKEHGVESRQEDHVRYSLALINYNKLREIQNETLPTTSAKSIAEAGERFSGRMVLIGDATNFGDAFNIPNHDDPVAGVHVIACAAYTLAAGPLFELNSKARIALDLIIAIGTLLLLEGVHLLYVKKRPGPLFVKAQGRAVLGVMIAVLFFGVVMVYRWHVVWFDFPLVLLASFLHPSVEQWFSKFWKILKAKWRSSNRS